MDNFTLFLEILNLAQAEQDYTSLLENLLGMGVTDGNRLNIGTVLFMIERSNIAIFVRNLNEEGFEQMTLVDFVESRGLNNTNLFWNEVNSLRNRGFLFSVSDNRREFTL